MQVPALEQTNLVAWQCSYKATHGLDAGRQIFTTPPSWTLKGRVKDIQITKSPGPIYDADRGYSYLEQVFTHLIAEV